MYLTLYHVKDNMLQYLATSLFKSNSCARLKRSTNCPKTKFQGQRIKTVGWFILDKLLSILNVRKMVITFFTSLSCCVRDSMQVIGRQCMATAYRMLILQRSIKYSKPISKTRFLNSEIRYFFSCRFLNFPLLCKL